MNKYIKHIHCVQVQPPMKEKNNNLSVSIDPWIFLEEYLAKKQKREASCHYFQPMSYHNYTFISRKIIREKS